MDFSEVPSWATAALFVLAPAGLLVGYVVVGLVLAKLTKRTRVPHGYAAPKVPDPFPPKRTIRDEPSRDAYKKAKVPAGVDHIVIGSGMGGLYCAALLARCGRKVVVLEQHYVAGGCLHEFEDHSWVFDTGLHYVGRMEKYKVLLDLVTDPSAEPVQWNKVGSAADGFIYDRIALEVQGGGEADKARSIVINLPAGREAFVNTLVGAFPKERAAIEEYVRLVVAVNKKSTLHFFGKLFPVWVERALGRWVNTEFERLAAKTVSEVLDGLTSDARLKAVLVGQFGDYGLPPGKASFFIHAGVVAHYLEGGYYPVGGPQNITRALIPTIERAGGRVLVRANVTGIIVPTGTNRAVGVRMENGDELLARRGVISSAGAIATFHRLLPDEVKARVLPQLPAPVRAPVETGISHLYAFVGMKGTQEELGLDGANLWRLPIGPDMDVDRMCEAAYTDPLDPSREPMVFIGFPSVKDPVFADKHPGRSTCIIITEAREEWFDPAKYGDAKSGKRGADYAALLEPYKARLLKALHTYYPKTAGRVEFCEMASPLTNKFYLGRSASYGLPPTPARFSGGGAGGLRPQTPVDGLWLTGQDMCVAGIVGALNGGLVTAHGILGYGMLDLIVNDRNLVEDLMNVDRKDGVERGKPPGATPGSSALGAAKGKAE